MLKQEKLISNIVPNYPSLIPIALQIFYAPLSLQ